MIRKQDALKQAQAHNEAEIAKAEKALDDAIRRGGAACVDIGYVNSAVATAIRDKYIEGGWTVSIQGSTQRDGVIVELK